MKFSRSLACIFGVLAPLVETIRRWGTWLDDPPATLDDYLMGALLLVGAWAAGRTLWGHRLLAAAWGFTCGLGYSSVFEHIRRLRLGEVDPAPVPSEVVLSIKVCGVVLAVVALAATVSSRVGAPGSPAA